MKGAATRAGARGHPKKGMTKGRLPIIAWRNLREDLREMFRTPSRRSETKIMART
jgi:hypothetical protein